MPVEKTTIVDGEEWTTKKLMLAVQGLTKRAAISRLSRFKNKKIGKKQLFRPYGRLVVKVIIDGDEWTASRLVEEVSNMSPRVASDRLLRFRNKKISSSEVFEPVKKRQRHDCIIVNKKYDAKKLAQEIKGLSVGGAITRIRKFRLGEITQKQLLGPVRGERVFVKVGKEEYTSQRLVQEIKGLSQGAAVTRMWKFKRGEIDAKGLLSKANAYVTIGGESYTSESLCHQVKGLSRGAAAKRLKNYSDKKINVEQLFAPLHFKESQQKKWSKNIQELIRREKVRQEVEEAGKIEESCRQRLKRNNRYDERGVCVAPVNPTM